MVIYRRHRGSLIASMDTATEVRDLANLVETIRRDREGWPDQAEVSEETVKIEFYGRDDRIGWTAYLVSVNGQVAGFTNGPL